MKKLVYILSIAIAFTCFYSCDSDDDFSAGDKPLAFSADIIAFDTVFTEIGSTTQHLKIYNRNNRSLNIESVQLESKGASGFRINLDGESGTTFTNVEILKKDSLFLFVEITVDPAMSASPIIKDAIRFTVGGVTQDVQLEAIGLDVYKWNNRIVTQDSIITGDKPILVTNTLTVAEGAKLTIAENTTLYFRRSAQMDVYGSVDMQGTPDKPIVLRGDRFDKISENIYWDNVPGQWEGVSFYPSSSNNVLSYTKIKNTTNGILFHESIIESKKAKLSGVTIQNSSTNCLAAINCDIDAENCLLANSGDATLKLLGGIYSFNFCTITNHYSWAPRKASTVVISNRLGMESRPLEQCNIYNSIIYGSYSNELSIDATNGAAINYYIASSLIRGVVSSMPNFESIIWNTNPMFRNLNNDGDYSYGFQLQSGSPAINAGSNSYPISTDIKGRSRPNGGGYDIGCYEWYEEE